MITNKHNDSFVAFSHSYINIGMRSNNIIVFIIPIYKLTNIGLQITYSSLSDSPPTS